MGNILSGLLGYFAQDAAKGDPGRRGLLDFINDPTGEDALRRDYMRMQMENMQQGMAQKRGQQIAASRNFGGFEPIANAPGGGIIWDTGRQDSAGEKMLAGMPQESQPFMRSLLQADPDKGMSLLGERMFPKPVTPTDDQREYNLAKEQGFNGSFMDYLGAKASVARSPEKPQGTWQDTVVNGIPAQRHSITGQVQALPQSMGPGNAPNGYRFKSDGGLEFIPGGPADPSTKPKGKAIPPNIAKGMLENLASAKKIDAAIESTRAAPDATGFWKGIGNAVLPGDTLNVLDPSGTDARAKIADLGSMIIHDRSGAAVTAAEFPRLKPFIPSPWDDENTVKIKLANFQNELRNILQDTADAYSADAGYAEFAPVSSYLSSMKQPEQQKQPKSGGDDLYSKYGLAR